MGRPRKTDDDVRATNASLRTMLSEVRGERDEAVAALHAVLTMLEGTEYDEKARQSASAAAEEERKTRGTRGQRDFGFDAEEPCKPGACRGTHPRRGCSVVPLEDGRERGVERTAQAEGGQAQ